MGISPRSGEKIMGKKLWEFEIFGVGKIMGISQSLKKTLPATYRTVFDK